MATVATTSIAVPLAAPNNPPITRENGTGYLYVIVRTGTDTLSLYRSTNSGGSWGVTSSFTHAGLQEWGSLVIDGLGRGHLMYRVGTGTADSLYYRYVDMNTDTFWPTGVLASSADANGGVIGSRWQGVDCTAYVTANNTSHILWAGGFYDNAGKYGCCLGALTMDGNRNVTQTQRYLISGTRFWLDTTSGRRGPSIEVEHNGDGITPAGSPNLWITWGRTRLYMVKVAWNGNGWTGPSAATTIRTSMGTHGYVPGTWDGTRFLIAIMSPDDATAVTVYQRNQANTSTTVLTTPPHPTGVIRMHAVSYDQATKDVRVFAVGTSSDVLYSIGYDRSADLWGGWTAVTGSAVLGSGEEWGVRRGGTTGNSRFDIITAHAGSPNSVFHTQQTLVTPPSVSSFILSGKAYVNGGPANVATSLPLTWTFDDPDAGESQGSYALSRQVGAGAIQYFTAAGGTWGASEVQNVSATQGVTLTSGWGADADSVHQYRVKVWDSAGSAATGYSPTLSLIPSAVVNPTITSPANAATITTSTLTVSWTVAQQTGVRVVLSQTSPAAYVAYDTGVMAGYTDTAYTAPVQMAAGTSWSFTLYTYNSEGLASTGQTRTFSVAYAPPPAALSTFAASSAAGTITVTPDVLAAVGTQPTIVESQLWRRERLRVNQLSNPSFAAGSTAGWSTFDGPSMTASVTQVRGGTHSVRLVPNGTGFAPRIDVQSASLVTASGLPGTAWEASAWVRPDTANKAMLLQINYYDAGGGYLGSVVQTFTAVVAAAWQYVSIQGTAGAWPTAAKVGMSVGLTGTPAVGDAFYVDEVSLRQADSTAGVRLYQETGGPAAVVDWGAASGVDYEYQWRLTGSNGTSQTSPWVG